MNFICRSSYALFFIILKLNICGQMEFSKWYFGNKAALDFWGTPPAVITTSSLLTIEGAASICDSTGNLLFYTNGVTVYNNSNAIMANGTGLLGDISSTQSAIIVKQPGNNSLYYIFTTDAEAGADGFRYSIVDMSLAGGSGSVTTKNIMLYTPTAEKQVAIRHCNGQDVWIVTHEYGPYTANKFHSYLLTAAGLSMTPVISTIGELIYDNGGIGSTAIGQLKVSPDGKKLAMAVTFTSSPAGLGNGGFQLFDFNTASGVISNSLVLLSGLNIKPRTGAYGVEFSPDGSKLYGSTICKDSTKTVLYQWNVCALTNSAIIASQYSMTLDSCSGQLQRAVDDKIYLARAYQQYISFINNPNGTGPAMNFLTGGVSVAPKLSFWGLPNYINQYSHVKPALFTFQTYCNKSIAFAAPPPPVAPTGCYPQATFPTSLLWNFGDPASGGANTSASSNPTHTFSSMGTFPVTLILFYPCTSDTLRQNITVDYCEGITENKETNFPHLFPNPANDFIYIEVKESTVIAVLDQIGSKLLEIKLEPGRNKISTLKFGPGIYIIKEENGRINWHDRLVIIDR
jgi:hypothetical protein